ncbi:hypothetical protein ACTFIR_001084 [Dictyostelium discoideum]
MVLKFQLTSVLILFIYFFNEINGSILSSSSSSSSSSSVDYYPIESSGRCDDYIGDTTQSDCSIYLPYKRIYISDTFNQTKSLETADRMFPLIQSTSPCNQPSVFKTLCSYLFPECQLYTNNKVVVAIPVLTCYEECTQSVSLCNGKGYFNCNQTLSSSGESVPRFPVDSYYYNFEEYQSGILDLKCRNTFKEDSDSNSNNNNNSSNNNNNGSNSDNVTPMPTETSSEEHNYNNSHRSLVFKIFITLCITVPIILIIALIWYNFKRRATKLKKLQEQQYQQQYQQQKQQQYLTININNEQTPLLN